MSARREPASPALPALLLAPRAGSADVGFLYQVLVRKQESTDRLEEKLEILERELEDTKKKLRAVRENADDTKSGTSGRDVRRETVESAGHEALVEEVEKLKRHYQELKRALANAKFANRTGGDEEEGPDEESIWQNFQRVLAESLRLRLEKPNGYTGERIVDMEDTLLSMPVGKLTEQAREFMEQGYLDTSKVLTTTDWFVDMNIDGPKETIIRNFFEALLTLFRPEVQAQSPETRLKARRAHRRAFLEKQSDAEQKRQDTIKQGAAQKEKYRQDVELYERWYPVWKAMASGDENVPKEHVGHWQKQRESSLGKLLLLNTKAFNKDARDKNKLPDRIPAYYYEESIPYLHVLKFRLAQVPNPPPLITDFLDRLAKNDRYTEKRANDYPLPNWWSPALAEKYRVDNFHQWLSENGDNRHSESKSSTLPMEVLENVSDRVQIDKRRLELTEEIENLLNDIKKGKGKKNDLMVKIAEKVRTLDFKLNLHIPAF
jgi:hypothetical protein